MPILEAHDSVKKIEKLLNQTVGRKGVKIKKILENLEPVIVGKSDGVWDSLSEDRCRMKRYIPEYTNAISHIREEVALCFTTCRLFPPRSLVLDGHLQSLPVERFPSFEVNSSMTRVPSALFLPILIKHSAIHHQGGVDADKVRGLRSVLTRNKIK